jgi:hypothetical protein
MMNRQGKQGDPQGTTSKGFFSTETRSLRILIWKAGNQGLMSFDANPKLNLKGTSTLA